MLEIILDLFFFSSRRRHTRSLCDWSSDVCSSDLPDMSMKGVSDPHGPGVSTGTQANMSVARKLHEIGRASCREREKNSEVAKRLKKKTNKNKKKNNINNTNRKNNKKLCKNTKQSN